MTLGNKIFFVISGLLLTGILYLLAPILTPFLTGAILAYLVNPIINRLNRWHLSRLWSIIIIFMILFLLVLLGIVLLIPLIQEQIDTLVVLVPKALQWFQTKFMPYVTSFFGEAGVLDDKAVKSLIEKNWAQAGSFVNVFLSTILQSGVLLFNWILNLIIIPVVTFYLLRDWNKLLKKIHSLIPKHLKKRVVKIAKECDEVLSGFFRGQLLVMLSLGCYYAIGLSLIRLEVGIILGILLGLISIVPYLGVIVGLITATFAAYLQFGTFHPILFIWILFGIGQILESLFLAPRFIGDRIGLHPVAVIFAILAGGTLFGFFGILLALPAAAVIMVWLRHLGQSYQESQYYQ